MKNELKKLLLERESIVESLKNDPTPVNYLGEDIQKEPTEYLLELDRRIARLRARR